MTTHPYRAALEDAAKVAEDEIECPGEAPPELHLVPLEVALRAAVRATKKNIARNIRALPVPASMEAAEGWVLVPREPTKEMIEAARWSWVNDQGNKSRQLWGSEASDIYRAMLSASLAPPKEGK